MSNRSQGVLPQSLGVVPSRTKFRTGPPIPIPPISVEAQTNGPNVYIAITNKDEDAAAIRCDAIRLSGGTNVAKLPWPMVWIGDGAATRLMKPDETQIVSVGSWRRVEHEPRMHFFLYSPMGEISLDEATFELRVRVHYGDEHTDYAIRVDAFTSASDGRVNCTASAIKWDDR